MNRLEVQMCLIDQEINQLVSKKNLIDIRLGELYEQREDLFVEWQNQNQRLVDDKCIIDWIRDDKDGDL